MDAEQIRKMVQAIEDTEMTDICFKVCGLSLDDDADADKNKDSRASESKPAFINAHKVILSIGSPVFKAMFYGALAEKEMVEISDISPSAFKKMLRYIYFDTNVELTRDDVVEVLYAAKKYDIEGLVKKCGNALDSMLTRDNAPTIFTQATLFCEDAVAARAIELLDRFAHYAINTNDVVRLFDRHLFKTILERDTFCAREVDIWDALVWWTKLQIGQDASPTAIREHIGDMLYLVR